MWPTRLDVLIWYMLVRPDLVKHSMYSRRGPKSPEAELARQARELAHRHQVERQNGRG